MLELQPREELKESLRDPHALLSASQAYPIWIILTMQTSNMLRHITKSRQLTPRIKIPRRRPRLWIWALPVGRPITRSRPHAKMTPVQHLLGLSILSQLLASVSCRLTISAALNVIEHVPLLVTSQDYFSASSQPIIVDGGVAVIVSNTTVDLAGNAETQALRQFANHTSLRILWNIASVPYRLVINTHALTADGTRNISSLADLRGKRVGTIPTTSAAYFVESLLKTAGLDHGDYSAVVGGMCHEAPCGNKTLP